MRQKEAKNTVKFAQQHMANERTYLAWIRTAISIVGIGFLTTSLHFTIGRSRNSTIDFVAILLGLLACTFGGLITVLATIHYQQKREQIDNELYRPANRSILFVSTIILALVIVIIIYFFFLQMFAIH